MMSKDTRTHQIIGAAMEVHRIIGPGHLEAVYHECLEREFDEREIPYVSQPQLQIYYKDKKLQKSYIPDLSALADPLWRNCIWRDNSRNKG